MHETAAPSDREEAAMSRHWTVSEAINEALDEADAVESGDFVSDFLEALAARGHEIRRKVPELDPSP